MKTGFCSVTFRQLGIDEIIDIAIKAGADGIEWGGDIHVTDVKTAASVAEKMKANGLAVLSYGSYCKCDGSEDEMRRLTDIADTLGAKYIRVWAGAKSPVETTDEERLKITQNLQAFCDIAAKKNISISLEYHRNTLTENADSAIRLFEEANRKNLKCQWQANPDISTEENRAELSELCGKNECLGNIHIFNMRRDNTFESLSDIEKTLAGYLDIIAAAGKDRNYIIEFCKGNDPLEFYKDMKVLKGILGEAKEE